MHRYVLISILLGFLLCLTASAMPLDKIHPALRAKMLSAEQEEFIPVTFKLSESFDTHGFMQRTQDLTKQERRALLIKEASAFAAERQHGILTALNLAKAEGAAEEIRPLWIVNMITARVHKEKIDSLAVFDQIEKVSWNRKFPHEMLQDAAVAPPDGAADALSWSVDKINSPAVWALGFEGQGVVLANIDSGTDYTHPDLASHIWNNADEIPNNNIDDDNNGYIDDTLGWDFENNDKDPMDTYGHGTSTAGIAVGDGTNGTQTGVAPKADLMVLRVGDETDHMAAQQYAITNGADVATSSYSFKWYFSPRPDYHAFRDASVMELAAGLFHNNSSSNDGTSVGIPWNISAPACCPPPWLHPQQTLVGDVGGTLGVGGTESDDSHYSPSPTGPSTWENLTIYDSSYPNPQNPAYWDYPYSVNPQGLIKVDVCCPTGGCPSTTIGGGYTTSFSGTSAATPHSGGASALIVCANPSITPEKICQAIKMNAKDLGAPGLDTLYGAGRMDVYEAVINVLSTFLADNPNPALGTNVTMNLKGPAESEYIMLFSFTLGKVVFPRIVTLDIYPPYLLLQSGYLNSAGEASFTFHVPNNPAHSGLKLYFQSVVDDTGGASGLYLASLHETVTIQ
ncbi:MAG: S8 family serine peptidase [Planctomycetota bacterium]